MPSIRVGAAEIAYEITGDGDPLLMIMGLAADSRMWAFQVGAFSSRYRCVLLDNRGTGRSIAPPGPLSIQEMASDAVAVLDAAGIERAHVLGISMGSAIAQHVALEAPERVRSLTLAATWCAKNPYLERLAELGRVVAELGHPALVRASILWLFTPAFILEQPHTVQGIESMALELQPPPTTFTSQVTALLDHETRARLASLHVPTRVLTGARDILVPPELSEQTARAIPGAELVTLDGGHAFNIENADAFNRAVLDFLEKH